MNMVLVGTVRTCLMVVGTHLQTRPGGRKHAPQATGSVSAFLNGPEIAGVVARATTLRARPVQSMPASEKKYNVSGKSDRRV